MKKRNLQPLAAKPVVRMTTGIKDDLLDEFPEAALNADGGVDPSAW